MPLATISLLMDDGTTHNAVFKIDQTSANNLLPTYKRKRDLMAREFLGHLTQSLTYAMTLDHLTDEQHAEHRAKMEGQTQAAGQPKLPDRPNQAAPRFTDEQIVAAAQAAHEVNREYCASIGDPSQKPWAESPDWQKESAVSGVKFAIANNFPSPEAMHDNWSKDKLKDGWKYGAKKDPKKKTHPCLVDYDKLPEEQRHKDDLFRLTIMSSLGVQ